MAKMFYTTEEAAAKLNTSPDQLKDYVTQNKLREFRDGARVMFKVDQVDRLATDLGGKKSSGDSALDLAPMESGRHDALSLADSDLKGPVPAKDDTVVTGAIKADKPAEKAMVFDADEIKAVDAAAQTQIQPAVEDQLSLEGVGSGSGLLDLTRESDDTSLGAELLEEIYPGGDKKEEGGIGSASGIFDQPVSPAETGSGPSGLVNMAEESHVTDTPTPVSVMAPVEYEVADPSAGAFGGMALAAVITMLVTGIILGSSYMGFAPAWVDQISADSTKAAIFGGILAGLALLFTAVGFFVGKATAR